jgi:hypothetical protein
MAHYRIYLVNGDNHFIDADVVACPTDDDALARAAELVSNECGTEVWNLARLVGRLEPRSKTNSLHSTSRWIV